MKSKKEMQSKKKTTPFSVLGLLFGTVLDELVCPLTTTLAIGLISFKLLTFIVTEIGQFFRALTIATEEFVKYIQYVYGQYLAFRGYKVVPLAPVPPTPSTGAQISSKTDMELKMKSSPKRATEERIVIGHLRQ